MRFFTAAAALALPIFLAGCEQTNETTAVTIDNAWVRLPAVPDRPGAAYFTVGTARPDVLLEVATPASARAEMHESVNRGAGMAAMRPLETLALGKGETRFEPGGKHVMLYDLDPALKPGDRTELTLRFSKAPAVTVQATLVAAGESYESE